MKNLITTTNKPWVQRLETTFDAFVDTLKSNEHINIEKDLFVFDARNMRTWDGIFKEFKKTMKLPEYCANNRDALDECILDSYGWLNNDFYILFFMNSDELLMEEKDSAEDFIEQMNEWAEEFSEGVFYEKDNINNRKPYPFHVFLGD